MDGQTDGCIDGAVRVDSSAGGRTYEWAVNTSLHRYLSNYIRQQVIYVVMKGLMEGQMGIVVSNKRQTDR